MNSERGLEISAEPFLDLFACRENMFRFSQTETVRLWVRQPNII